VSVNGKVNAQTSGKEGSGLAVEWEWRTLGVGLPVRFV
jgi:hypothetical protein